MNQRGSSMGVVLITITLATILIFASMSAGLQQLNLSNHLQLRGRARDSAESVLHLAIAKLAKDPTFGAAHQAGAVLRCDVPGLEPGCSAVLSFEPGTAAANHIPVSTNNIASDASTVGDGGRTIPGYGCHLIALGQCYSEKIQIETIYLQPPFPTGCASSGPVKLQSVRLWGIPPSTVMQTSATTSTGFLQNIPPIPAHVYTNSRTPNGLILGPGTSIRGNAACSGGIVQDPTATVDGEVQPNSRDNPVPHYDVQGMFNNIAQYVGQVPYIEGQPVQSFCVVGSDLNIAGDCEISGGVLAVQGNLSIQGSLKGQGFIIATGSVTGNGNSSFEGTDKIALLAGGALTLAGQNQSTHTFNGILYSQGNIQAHDLTVIGSLICDSPNGTGTVDLQRIRLAQTDVAIVTRVNSQIQPYGATSGQICANMMLVSNPTNPLQQVLAGTISYNNQSLGTQNHSLPSPLKQGWVMSFTPPVATFTRFANGGAIVSTQQLPYAGAPSLFLPGENEPSPPSNKLLGTQMASIFTTFTGKSPSSDVFIDCLSRVVDQAHDLSIPSTLITRTYDLELNNLLPTIDRTRVVTWVESAPTR